MNMINKVILFLQNTAYDTNSNTWAKENKYKSMYVYKSSDSNVYMWNLDVE